MSNRAKINALQYAQQVESACEAFKVYAEPKIKEIEDEVTAAELLKSLVSVTGNIVGGGVTGTIASKLSQQIVSAIAAEINDKIKDKTKDAASNKDDAEALKKAVGSIAMGARDAATKIQEKVGSVVDPVVNSIVVKLNANQSLSESEDELLGMFYMAPPSAVDEYVERFLGIPRVASAKETHVKLFIGLVRKFEEKRILAQASLSERYEMALAEGFGATKLTLAYKARQRAKAAARERRRALERK